MEYGITDENGDWLAKDTVAVAVDPAGCAVVPVDLTFPSFEGSCHVRAVLKESRNPTVCAYSQKIAHVFGPTIAPDDLKAKQIAVREERDELSLFLQQHGIRCEKALEGALGRHELLIIGSGGVRTSWYKNHIDEITESVTSGKPLLVLEPELDVAGKELIPLLRGLDLTIERRLDADRGGYDSYIFAEDHHHPLWKGLLKEHLKMFNGAFGGEIISQHNVVLSMPHTVHARCGIGLAVIGVVEVSFGDGRVFISRVQLGGRLIRTGSRDSLYSRHVDPIAQRYLLNVISYLTGPGQD